MANTLSLEFEVRPTHCMEPQTKDAITVHVGGEFGAYLLSAEIQLFVRNEGQPVTDFDLKMHINTTDVYPADTVQINVTMKNTELSKCECKLLMLDLHAGPWVTDGELIDVSKQNTKSDKTDLRRMEVRTDDFVSMENWNFSVNVKFKEQFDFSEYIRLRILSFTLMLYCQLQFPIDNYHLATDHAVENVVLHSERNKHYQFNQLIHQTPSETGKCQVRTWTSTYLTTDAESVKITGKDHIDNSPYNRRHITILLGKTCELYYIHIHLTDASGKWFSGHISTIADGRAFSDIEECTFTADHGNSYTCVFKIHFRARGLRIIPTKPVLKHKVTQFGVHLYGIAFGKDIRQFALATFAYPKIKCTGLVMGHFLRWFDLGPMVSQVITYQKEDKRYFAFGPERNSIVSTGDLTDNWIGITISEYRK
ncbi:hypothetical protein D915_009532 [Fasciola hepatica]|uniref:Uncharacterized protein n=1 Tax=Fasciola hepatica TaxID=6192 RepID=A0A4E0REJ3_FASHE|nr:hypothetical protein D915_009532 [Fasciola hepatica]